ncbi:MAG TPA: YCF48-related protein, partial [Myxococcota bacterium]
RHAAPRASLGPFGRAGRLLSPRRGAPMRDPIAMISAAGRILLIALAWAGCHESDFVSRRVAGEIGIYDDLFSVSVADASHAVAVGYHGAVYWSDDGGESWHEGQTQTEALLYSVSMADRHAGWAVGQLGTILRTEDGGRSWRAQPNPKRDERTHLFGVHAFDRDRAVAVGEWGARIATRDGGAHWIDASLAVGPEDPQFIWLSPEARERVRAGGRAYEDVSLHDVHCLRDGAACWSVGEFGTILRSPDAGATWERGEILGEAELEPVRLGFGQTALDPDDAARLADFARRIERRAHLNVRVDPFVSAREIAAHYDGGDPEVIFEILAARIDAARAVLEQAGLTTDRIRAPHQPPWNHAEFAAYDAAFVQRYLAGRRAQEAGIAVSVIQNPVLFTVRFANADEGLIAGLGGVILRSVDGGRTWRYAQTSGRAALFSVATAGARGVAVGERGAVLYSEDGGRSWQPPEASQVPPALGFLRDLRFAPDGAGPGFIVGREGVILRSRDGGASWTQVLPPPAHRTGLPASTLR